MTDPFILAFSLEALFTSHEFWMGFVIVLLLFVIWLLTRHQECGYSGEPEGKITDLSHALAGLTHGSVSEGNSVTLIQGPDYFGSVCRDISKATHSVHFETFLWEAGKASDLIAAALCEAAGRGVKVRVLTDARGSSGMGAEVKEKLREAGCEHHSFHRWRLMNLGRFNIRDHRKIVIIDGRTAYAGGHCITDSWLEEPGKASCLSGCDRAIHGAGCERDPIGFR